MLKMTKIKLELIPDPDTYIFFEKGTRGGISYMSNRYSKANNRYLKSYDPKQESKHITHLDTKNLYGYAMYKFLPTSGFKWIDDLNKYTSNSSKVQKDVLSKLILNIQKNYENHTMIII